MTVSTDFSQVLFSNFEIKQKYFKDLNHFYIILSSAERLPSFFTNSKDKTQARKHDEYEMRLQSVPWICDTVDALS